MKKILMAMMLVALVAALVGVGVYAEFSDTETSTQNSFTAGTLNLTVDNYEGVSVPVYINETNLKPGDGGTVSMTLANVGSIDGEASIEADITAEGGGKNNYADLAASIDVSVTYAGTLKWSGKLVNLTVTVLGSLNASASEAVKIDWSLPSSAGNEVAGDSVVFNLVFTLNQ